VAVTPGDSKRPLERLVSGHEEEVPEVPRPGRVVRSFVGAETGAQRLSAGVVTFPAKTDSVPHVHEDHEEVLYVVSGQGQLVCDGRPIPLEAGSFVFIPPHVEHFVRNDGDDAIRFFYAFSPPIVIGSW
jgi:quercetin dioxygenase-like cupin family protein